MVKQPFSKSLIPEQWGLRHTIEGTLAVKNIVAGNVVPIIVINFVSVRKVEEHVVTVKVRIDKSGFGSGLRAATVGGSAAPTPS